MMIQWEECKTKAKDAILLFRLGDFYEAFHEDAHLCARELDLTLTKRQHVPMSGIPAHAADSYIDKLVSKGYKVAIAEQIGDPKQSKGLVKREIVRILSPGTIQSSALLLEKSHNFFVAITQVGQLYGVAYLDLSCHECHTLEVTSSSDLLSALVNLKPSELLTSPKFYEKNGDFFNEFKQQHTCLIDLLEDWHFDHQFCYGFLTQLFKVQHLDSYGLKGKVAAINAAGALLTYIRDHLYHSLDALECLTFDQHESYLSLDPTTLRNLELVDSLYNASRSTTLLEVLDYTRTPMGGRQLRRWILRPLVVLSEIQKRQTSVEEFLHQDAKSLLLKNQLALIKDLERLMTKITSGYASPRDYIALKHSLIPIAEIKTILENFNSSLLLVQLEQLSDFKPVIDLISRSIVEEPPLKMSDGGIFQSGYNETLDELRLLTQDSKLWMAHYQHTLRESSGIKTLKVGFSTISGFYIEVSKGQTNKVPENFQRRQTLTNGERYTTEELKIYEEKLLTAEEKIAALEENLFKAFQEEVIKFRHQVFEAATSIANVDALSSLAEAAFKHRYTKPLLNENQELEIIEGRHPVIEKSVLLEKFQPNDTYLNAQEQRLMIITGPNMAGKSTYIRQVALIIILAQMGSFVPAKMARIGIIDKVFTRIGASDDLSRGQSTFMVEMSEAAYILHHATSRSLVILDELGRGTSTYDGIAIAWSIAEHLLLTPGKTPKTLFATHYWELTKLEEKIQGAINYHIAVAEREGHIHFLRKIVRGGTDKSYGIHVARLAGMPTKVLERATEILHHLEQHGNQKNLFEPTRGKRISPAKPLVNEKTEVQLAFF